MRACWRSCLWCTARAHQRCRLRMQLLRPFGICRHASKLLLRQRRWCAAGARVPRPPTWAGCLLRHLRTSASGQSRSGVRRRLQRWQPLLPWHGDSSRRGSRGRARPCAAAPPATPAAAGWGAKRSSQRSRKHSMQTLQRKRHQRKAQRRLQLARSDSPREKRRGPLSRGRSASNRCRPAAHPQHGRRRSHSRRPAMQRRPYRGAGLRAQLGGRSHQATAMPARPSRRAQGQQAGACGRSLRRQQLRPAAWRLRQLPRCGLPQWGPRLSRGRAACRRGAS